MVNKDMIIRGVSDQRDMLKDVVETLEQKPELDDQDIQYCDEVLKKVETTLRKIRQNRYDSGRYHEALFYRILTKI